MVPIPAFLYGVLCAIWSVAMIERLHWLAAFLAVWVGGMLYIAIEKAHDDLLRIREDLKEKRG